MIEFVICMHDYEEAILSKQESDADDCSSCEYLESCRSGKEVTCPWS